MNDTEASSKNVGANTLRPGLEHLIVEPYLHFDAENIYNPMTDKKLDASHFLYSELLRLTAGQVEIASLPESMVSELKSEGWLADASEDLDKRFYLKYAVIEGSSGCNQSCYFCPVSIERREEKLMPLDLFSKIVVQLSEFKDVIQGVFLLHYNEPTSDPLFMDRVKILKAHGLRVALNSNGTGLTPKRVDQLLEMGGLRYLSINLSTLDREKYRRDRGADHLDLVLRNLDYAKRFPIAQQMNIAVIGEGDDVHKRDFDGIRGLFDDSHFSVLYFESMDRAGFLNTGHKPPARHEKLRGCMDVGSRPLQFIHVDYRGTCVLCCQDYKARYVVGDLTRQTIREVLVSQEFARVRRWVYGREEAPSDFICRDCVFARS